MHNYSWNASAGRTSDWFAGKRDAVKFDAPNNITKFFVQATKWNL